MTTETGYNGWTNYETWNVALWYGNEQGWDDQWRERAEDLLWDNRDDDHDTWKEGAIEPLAEEMKSEAEENTPTTSGFYADLLNAALSEVNWREIARHYVDEAFDEVAEELNTEDEEDSEGDDQ